MLRVTLEMVPFGQEATKRTIGVIEISNIGGDSNYGKYEASLLSDEDTSGKKDVFIDCFERSNGAWSLVRRAISKLKL